VAPGIAAWGLMTGVAMVKSGMSVSRRVAMTLLVYAGSSQLAAIPLIVAGAPLWVIWAPASASTCASWCSACTCALPDAPAALAPLVNGFLTADMSYALFTQPLPEPRRTTEAARAGAFLAGNYFVTWLAGSVASLLGIALGNLIPSAWGLGFAGVLCLVGILCSLANTPLRLLAACSPARRAWRAMRCRSS
jgi:predicted branched-subunit amino acid permease